MAGSWAPMLEELSLQRQGRLLAFATMLAGPSVAEDLVQEAVVATFSKSRGFESVTQAEQYVRRAIASKYVDMVRSSASRRKAERASVESHVTADASARLDAKVDLGKALEHLSPRERACVVLRFLEGLSVRETADQLGLSEGAVKRYVFDGLRTLNDLLGTHATDSDVVPVRGSLGKGVTP